MKMIEIDPGYVGVVTAPSRDNVTVLSDVELSPA